MKRKKRLVISFIVLFVFLGFCWVQNNWLVVSHYTYESKKLPQEFEGYRIVQISDLHNVSFGAGNVRLLEKIDELSPDMVVITGDVVDSNHTDLEVAITFAEQVAEKYSAYYVTGNHENWLEESERQVLLKGLEEAGVVCLMDTSVEIQRGDSSITLVGLNDESLSGPMLNLVLSEAEKTNCQEISFGEDAKMEELSVAIGIEKQEVPEGDGAGMLQILLAHEPQYIENYSKYGVDLVLTGHAHGGQFRLPFVGGGLVAPDQGFFPKYTEGVHLMDETTMIISRGLGNSIIPVRLFNLPEIVCVELRGDSVERTFLYKPRRINCRG